MFKVGDYVYVKDWWEIDHTQLLGSHYVAFIADIIDSKGVESARFIYYYYPYQTFHSRTQRFYKQVLLLILFPPFSSHHFILLLDILLTFIIIALGIAYKFR